MDRSALVATIKPPPAAPLTPCRLRDNLKSGSTSNVSSLGLNDSSLLELGLLEPKAMTKYWHSAQYNQTKYDGEAFAEAERIERKGESYKQHCARRFYAEGYRMLNSLRRRPAREGESIHKVARAFTLAVILIPNMAKAWIARGKTHVLMGDDARGYLDFSMAIDLDDEDATLYYERSWCLRRLSVYNKAVEDMLVAAELDVDNAQYAAVLGDLYLKLDKLSLAAAAYEQCIGMSGRNAGGSMLSRAYFNLGLCLWGQLKTERAIPHISTACQLDEKNSTYQFLLGEAYLEVGNLELADKAYSRAIALKDSDPTFHHHRGICRFSVGTRQQVIGAIEDFDRAIEQLGDAVTAPLLFERARAMLSLQEPAMLDRIIEDSSRASDMDRSNVEYYHVCGLARERKGQLEAALDCYENALKCDYQHGSAKFHAGQIYHRLGHLRNALNCYSSLILTVTDDPRLFEARGLVFNDLEAYHRAEKDFSRALELSPASASLYYHRGVAHKHLGHFELAKDDFKRALELGIQEPACVYIERGIMLKHNKQYDEALQDLDAALAADPDNTRTRLYRGLCFLDKEEYDKAEKQFIAAEDVIVRTGHLKKLHWMVRYNLGLTYYHRKQWPMAVQTLDSCLSFLSYSPPDDSALPGLCYVLGVALASLDRHVDAEQAFGDAIRLHIGTVKELWLARMERAKCLLHLRRYEDSLKELNEVIRLSPHNGNAHFLRGWTHKNLQDYTSAADDFMQAQLLEPSNRSFEVNFKGIYDIRWVVLCPPGEEKDYEAT